MAWILSKLPFLSSQPNSISEIDESFANAIVDTVDNGVPPPTTPTHAQVVRDRGSLIRLETKIMGCEKACPASPAYWEYTVWKALTTARASPRRPIGLGLHAYFGEYLAETEKVRAGNDRRGFYHHSCSTVGLDDRDERSGQFIRDGRQATKRPCVHS